MTLSLGWLIILDVIFHVCLAATDEGRWWLTGQAMNGRRKSDATFWSRARHGAIAKVSYVSRWSLLAGWERAATRLGLFHLAVFGVWGWIYEPRLTKSLLVVFAVAALMWGTYSAWRMWNDHEHNTQVVKPLHDLLKGPVGLPAHKRPKDWISVDRDIYTNPDSEAVILLPTTFSTEERECKRVAEMIARKFGGDYDAQFRLASNKPKVILRHVQQPPERVSYGHALEHLRTRPAGCFLLGYGAGWQPMWWHWADDATAHLLISLWSGGGKSTLLRNIMAQAHHDGFRVIVIDGKHISHAWADGLPGVVYARTPDEIEQTLLQLQATIQARYGMLRKNPDAQFEQVLVVLEEMNATKAWMTAHHRSRGGRSTPPSVAAIAEAAFTARQAGIHLVTVAQLATANSMGGGDVRENYPLRVLSSRAAFGILAKEITEPPTGILRSGYFFIVRGGHYYATQGVYLTDVQARHYAEQGLPALPAAPPHPEPPEPEKSEIAPDEPHLRLIRTEPEPEPEPEPAEIVDEQRTLRQWWEAGLLESDGTFRAALMLRQRDQDRGIGPIGEMIPGGGNTLYYRRSEIEAWNHRRKVAEEQGVADARKLRPREPKPVLRRVRVTLSSTERGYGQDHKKIKEKLIAELRDGDICARQCGRPLLRSQIPTLHLDHTDDRKSYLGLAHAECNLKAGGRKGAQRRTEMNRRFPTG